MKLVRISDEAHQKLKVLAADKKITFVQAVDLMLGCRGEYLTWAVSKEKK